MNFSIKHLFRFFFYNFSIKIVPYFKTGVLINLNAEYTIKKIKFWSSVSLKLSKNNGDNSFYLNEIGNLWSCGNTL